MWSLVTWCKHDIEFYYVQCLQIVFDSIWSFLLIDLTQRPSYRQRIITCWSLFSPFIALSCSNRSVIRSCSIWYTICSHAAFYLVILIVSIILNNLSTNNVHICVYTYSNYFSRRRFEYFKCYSGRKGTEKEIELIRKPSRRISLTTKLQWKAGFFWNLAIGCIPSGVRWKFFEI